MYPVARFTVYVGAAARVAVTLALLLGGLLLYRAHRIAGGARAVGHETAPSLARSLPEPAEPALSILDWSRVLPLDVGVPVAADGAARRFRLSGTFLEYGAESPTRRRAVLQDLEAGTESILGEGESADGVEMVRIFQDHVVLRADGTEQELWMAFTGRARGASADEDAADEDAEGALRGADRFGGKRIAENRWVFGREQLMAFYEEMMNDPRRLIKVFDSMQPRYTDDGKIEGYRLHIVGEPDFFDSVGLREGDVVKRVNSVEMTNRRRAEFFIEQFVKGRSTAFVLDVEREDGDRKLIYEVR